MKHLLWLLLFVSGSALASSVEVGDPQIGSSLAGGTAGSMLFIKSGPIIGQDNSNLFWDATKLRLGIHTTTPDGALTISQNSSSVAPLTLKNANDGGPLVILYDHGGTNSLSFAAPSAFTVPYQLTWPVGLGASGGLLSVGPSGTMALVSGGVSQSTLNNTLAVMSGAKNIASAASTANITVSGLPTIDGVDLSATSGGIVLLKNQTDDTTNGLYFVDPFGTWTRDVSMPVGDCDGMILTVGQGGTLNAGTVWLSSCNGSDITFTRIGHGPGIVSSTTNTSATCSASCSGVQVLKGGGCQNSGALVLQSSYPSSATAWSCTYTTAAGNCTAKAICE